MKHTVKFSCGHEETIELLGSSKEREQKIQYMQQYCTCHACKNAALNAQKSVGCQEVTMSYKQYKTEYAYCETKAGTYDPANKTIVVYVPDVLANTSDNNDELPQLIGSQYQITDANNVRNNILDKNDMRRSFDYYIHTPGEVQRVQDGISTCKAQKHYPTMYTRAKLLVALATETSAKWWIDFGQGKYTIDKEGEWALVDLKAKWMYERMGISSNTLLY